MINKLREMAQFIIDVTSAVESRSLVDSNKKIIEDNERLRADLITARNQLTGMTVKYNELAEWSDGLIKSLPKA